MLRKILQPLVSVLGSALVSLPAVPLAYASLLGQVQGIVHDPGHRPIAGARFEGDRRRIAADRVRSRPRRTPASGAVEDSFRLCKLEFEISGSLG